MKYFIGIFLLLFYTTGFAYTIKGAGTISCGRYIDDKRNSPGLEHVANMHWVQGFITGVNYSSTKNYGSGIDMIAMAQYLENYCQDHPLNNLAEASEKLLNALQNR